MRPEEKPNPPSPKEGTAPLVTIDPTGAEPLVARFRQTRWLLLLILTRSSLSLVLALVLGLSRSHSFESDTIFAHALVPSL